MAGVCLGSPFNFSLVPSGNTKVLQGKVFIGGDTCHSLQNKFAFSCLFNVFKDQLSITCQVFRRDSLCCYLVCYYVKPPLAPTVGTISVNHYTAYRGINLPLPDCFLEINLMIL